MPYSERIRDRFVAKEGGLRSDRSTRQRTSYFKRSLSRRSSRIGVTCASSSPDVDEAVRQIVALGGSSVSGPRPGGGVTMADPEGNEFCLGAFRRTKDGKRKALG